MDIEIKCKERLIVKNNFKITDDSYRKARVVKLLSIAITISTTPLKGHGMAVCIITCLPPD